MAFPQIAFQALSFGVNTLQAGRAQRQQLRDAREQQALNNQEIVRQLNLMGRQEVRPAAERRLALGGAGVRAGSATASAIELDAQNQLRFRQEELARQIDTSLQDVRTQQDPITKLWKSYTENVWRKPGRQVNKEFNRTKKRVKKFFKKLF